MQSRNGRVLFPPSYYEKLRRHTADVNVMFASSLNHVSASILLRPSLQMTFVSNCDVLLL